MVPRYYKGDFWTPLKGRGWLPGGPTMSGGFKSTPSPPGRGDGLEVESGNAHDLINHDFVIKPQRRAFSFSGLFLS